MIISGQELPVLRRSLCFPYIKLRTAFLVEGHGERGRGTGGEWQPVQVKGIGRSPKIVTQ